MDHVNVIGILAGSLNTMAFVPQLIKLWRSKSGGDLSLSMLIIYDLGMLLWIIYGLILTAFPIIFFSTLNLFFALSITYLKLRHYKNTRDNPNPNLQGKSNLID